MKTYRILRDLYYRPLGDRYYPAGTRDGLRDWRKAHVASAIQAGLIEEVADDGQNNRQERGHPGPGT